MNVLTKIRLINELNEKELRMGVVNTNSSWHNQYKDSAWIYIGNLPFELSEGDVVCVCSQYGEIVNINMIRDKKTGKSKGFAFVCYEDQRSTVLAVDNLNGSKIKNRQMRVDHVLAYKVPKENEDIDELTQKIHDKGVAPSVMQEYDKSEQKSPTQIVLSDDNANEKAVKKKKKKEKKEKKKLSFLKEKPAKKAFKPIPDYISSSDSGDDTRKSQKKKHLFDKDELKTPANSNISKSEKIRNRYDNDKKEKYKYRQNEEDQNQERNRRDRPEIEESRHKSNERSTSSCSKPNKERDHKQKLDRHRSPDHYSHDSKRRKRDDG